MGLLRFEVVVVQALFRLNDLDRRSQHHQSPQAVPIDGVRGDVRGDVGDNDGCDCANRDDDVQPELHQMQIPTVVL